MGYCCQCDIPDEDLLLSIHKYVKHKEKLDRWPQKFHWAEQSARIEAEIARARKKRSETARFWNWVIEIRGG